MKARIKFTGDDEPGVYELRWQNDSYIGGTTRKKRIRVNEHLRAMEKREHSNWKLQQMYDLYGRPRVKSLINTVYTKNIWQLEQNEINKNNPTLNLTKIVTKY